MLRYKNSLIVFASIFIITICFVYGYRNGICIGKSEFKINVQRGAFLRILLQNVGFFLLLLFGALFYNISNFFLLMYNGNLWGLTAKFTACSIGLSRAFFLVTPHIFIEMLWITLTIRISIDLSDIIYRLFIDKIDSTVFILKLKSMRYRFLFAFLLVIVGVVIEVFISPYVFNHQIL